MSTRPDDTSSGPPLRALAMVLLSLAVVFAGIGIFSLTGSDSEETAAAPAADTSAVPTATAAPTGTSAPAEPSSTAPPSATSGSPTTTTTATTSGSASASSGGPIRVLNNSEVSGLAAETATRLESAGFPVGETGNYSSGVIAASTVYYDPAVPGQQAQAERIARTLGFGSEPRFAGIANASPGIVVIVTR